MYKDSIAFCTVGLQAISLKMVTYIRFFHFLGYGSDIQNMSKKANQLSPRNIYIVKVTGYWSLCRTEFCTLRSIKTELH